MKSKTITLGVLLASTLVASCALPDSRSFNPAAVQVERDDFKKQTRFMGPNCAAEFGNSLFLRAWKRDSAPGAIDYQVYAIDNYTSDWRFYSEAYDSDGQRLDFMSIDRKVGYCSKYVCSKDEHMGISVSHDYLVKHSGTGMTFKVSGRGGEKVFALPASCIQAFLDRAQ